MPRYLCEPCGLNWSVNSGQTCYSCGQPAVKVFTENEVQTIVNTPAPSEIEQMFQNHLKNHGGAKT